MFRRPLRRGPSLIRAAATTAVVVGTASAVSGAAAKRGQQQAAQAQAAQPQVAPGTQPPQPAPAADQVQRLQELTTLHSSGALTDEEFAAAKAKVLG
jgi:hypothetical protein